MTTRYIFVAGLHRSGTSLVARAIAGHPRVGAIAGSPAPEDEGVYLQGAIPHTAKDGRPGAFAHDPAQHLTEASRFNTLDTLRYIEAQWDRWYDPALPWRVEKSPVNLLRTRLYQQMFPSCVFVLVTRHPVAVSMATRKWSEDSFDGLMAHWGAAHDIVLDDLACLHRWIIVRYEDFVAGPDVQLDRIAALAELPAFAPFADAVADRNADYLSAAPPAALPGCAARFGYGDAPGWTVPMPAPAGRHVYHSITRRIEEARAGTGTHPGPNGPERL